MVRNLDSQEHNSPERADANAENLALLSTIFNNDFGPAIRRFNEAFYDFQKSKPYDAEAAIGKLDESMRPTKRIYDILVKQFETIDETNLNESQKKSLSDFKRLVNTELKMMKGKLIVAQAALEGKLAELKEESFLTKTTRVVRVGKRVAGKGMHLAKRGVNKSLAEGPKVLIPKSVRSFLGNMADYTDHFGFLD